MKHWENRKVLVTGAGGFIGSHLAQALITAGASTRALVHYNSRGSRGNLELLSPRVLREVEVIFGDVRDPFGVREAVRGCDTVFHLAALIGIPYSYVAPQSYVGTNIEGTLNVLQACRAEGLEKIVHTSTSETYGTALYTPIDEKHPLQGQSPYSASKIGADKLAESYHRSFDLPVATIRPFNTYGPRQSSRAVIPTIVSQLLSGGDEVRLGSLSPVRDLTFVGDTVRGFLDIGESRETVGKVINVGSGRGTTVGELASTIMTVVGREVGIVTDETRVRPEKSEVLKLICDYSLAHETTGWSPQTSLVDGLTRTVEFYRQWAVSDADSYHI